MALRLFIICILVAGTVYAVPEDNEGGCWLSPRLVGFSSGMGTSSHNVYSMGNIGSVLLSCNYYTVMQIDTGSTVYTYGIGYDGEYDPDSTGCDGTALYLDGYVTQDIQLAFFFMYTDADTFMATVEQALRYDTVIGDSGFAYGFVTTDTLFTDNFNATRDTCFIPNVSEQGDDGRQVNDSFELVAPCIRIKIKNMGAASLINLNIEMYSRHTEQVMSGVSGRLTHQIEREVKVPIGRSGLGQ